MNDIEQKEQGMELEEFETKFKALFFKTERERKGTDCIRSKEILYDFIVQNPSLHPSNLEKYFNHLKSSGKIFAFIENEVEVFIGLTIRSKQN